MLPSFVCCVLVEELQRQVPPGSQRNPLLPHFCLPACPPACRYYTTYRRYNYTTPKSYLELIALYKSLLDCKRGELRAAKGRVENGVDKISQASWAVEDLQRNLQQEQVVVEEKKATTQALIESIGQEKAVVDEAVEAGRGDEEEAANLSAEVTAFQAECAKVGFVPISSNRGLDHSLQGSKSLRGRTS